MHKPEHDQLTVGKTQVSQMVVALAPLRVWMQKKLRLREETFLLKVTTANLGPDL